MRIIIPATVALVVLLMAQILVWRTVRSVRQYVALPTLILLVLAAATAAVLIQHRLAGLGAFLPRDAFEYVNFVLLYGALALAYVVTYPAIQADSPSFMVLILVDRAGPAGLSRDELAAALGDGVLVTPRLEDLVAGNIVSRRGDRYVVGRGGALLARIHLAYRRLLTMETGG